MLLELNENIYRTIEENEKIRIFLLKLFHLIVIILIYQEILVIIKIKQLYIYQILNIVVKVITKVIKK